MNSLSFEVEFGSGKKAFIKQRPKAKATYMLRGCGQMKGWAYI